MKRVSFIFFLVLSTVGCDQVTKIVAQKTLQSTEMLSYFNDIFRLQYAENKGAFLSFGASLPENMRTFLFMVLVTAFLSVVAYQLITERLDSWSTVSYSLLLGGGIGNLIDRITRGSVVDFLNLGFGTLRTGIFNIADMAVVAALVILLLKPKLQSPLKHH